MKASRIITTTSAASIVAVFTIACTAEQPSQMGVRIEESRQQSFSPATTHEIGSGTNEPLPVPSEPYPRPGDPLPIPGEPAPQPLPEPQPDPGPNPDPYPLPEPSPLPIPNPDPMPDPEPEPLPDPEPEPLPDPDEAMEGEGYTQGTHY